MIRRVTALTGYLFKWQQFSIAGGVFWAVAAIFWVIFYNPTGGDVPDPDQFTLLLTLFGAAISLFATLTISSRANRAISYPMFVRLPSRVEYMLSVMLASVSFVLLIQVVLGIVILLQPNGPDVPLGKLLEVPPLWISINCLFSVLALHGTDLVAAGWSRVYLFGLLTFLLFSQNLDVRSVRWVTNKLNDFATSAAQRGWMELSASLREAALWFTSSGKAFFTDTVGFVFWPFRAISDAVQFGAFDNAQALAPAIILLYATILFMLAADLFATKDLYLTE